MPRFVLLVVLLLTITGQVMAEDAGRSLTERSYPHDKGHCDICHVTPEAALNSWFTFASTKKKLLKDYNSLCLQCHDIDLGHGMGKSPRINRELLPLDSEGKITCAITCHNMHVMSDDQKQRHYHLRTSVNRLCKSCHDN